MRKVIGIGETILDIIFQDNQPRKAVPGGSTFNCMVSLGRTGIPALFISELGQDKVGRLIRDFMSENNLSSQFIDFFEEGSSPIALAFLDRQQNAEYQFYKAFPKKRLSVDFPEINENDIVIFGSYFALNPDLRDKVVQLLNYAKSRKAIIYYDINFRKAHAAERLELMDNFVENFNFSTIIRCSDEDLDVLYPGKSIDEIYQDIISPVCKNFIVTKGGEGIILKTDLFEKEYSVKALSPISTIGAGDNFNAGLIYSIIKENIDFASLSKLKVEQWDKLIEFAKLFSAEVCLSYDNYVSKDFAASL